MHLLSSVSCLYQSVLFSRLFKLLLKIENSFNPTQPNTLNELNVDTDHSSFYSTPQTTMISSSLSFPSKFLWIVLIVLIASGGGGHNGSGANNDSPQNTGISIGFGFAMASTVTPSQLYEARSKWENLSVKYGPLSYSFGLEETVKINGEVLIVSNDDDDDGFVGFFDDVPTIVRVDNTNNVIDICSGDINHIGGVDSGSDHNRLTVEGFFKLIEVSILDESSPQDVKVVFHPVLGYPLLIIFTNTSTSNQDGTVFMTTTTTTFEILSFMLYNVLQADLDKAISQWNSANVSAYNFMQSIACSICNPIFRIPKRVYVQGDDIMSIVDENTGLEEDVVPSWQATVTGLFERAQSSIDNQDYSIEITYDDELGFPTYLFWNHHPGLMDGSVSFSSWNMSATGNGPTIAVPNEPSAAIDRLPYTNHPSSGPSEEPIYFDSDPDSHLDSLLPSSSPTSYTIIVNTETTVSAAPITPATNLRSIASHSWVLNVIAFIFTWILFDFDTALTLVVLSCGYGAGWKVLAIV
jgi:Family of unknown function (DUF6174)